MLNVVKSYYCLSQLMNQLEPGCWYQKEVFFYHDQKAQQSTPGPWILEMHEDNGIKQCCVIASELYQNQKG